MSFCAFTGVMDLRWLSQPHVCGSSETLLNVLADDS